MPFEIELKARLDDPEAARNRLSELGKLSHTYEKDDTYWVFPVAGSPRLRLRREIKTDSAGRTRSVNLLTCKTREMRGGVEINDEQELTISDAAVFEKILSRLGLTPLLKKEKRGSAWQCGTEAGPSILAELSEVKNLGWFIELEILSPVRGEEVFRENRTRLLALLDRLNIPREKIETRPYAELLSPPEEQAR